MLLKHVMKNPHKVLPQVSFQYYILDIIVSSIS